MEEEQIKKPIGKDYHFLCFQLEPSSLKDKKGSKIKSLESRSSSLKLKKQENRCRIISYDCYDPKQMVGMQVFQVKNLCETQEKINSIKAKNQRFENNEFIQSQTQLKRQGHSFSSTNQSQNAEQEWSSIYIIMEGSKIFVDKPTPNDVIQGNFGNCYFLAALAGLAERPTRIYNLFLQHQNNENNYFSVVLLLKGQWINILLDDKFPTQKNIEGKPELSGSKPVDNQMWVLLLQKAWAQLYITYKDTVGGYAQQALHSLTGAPYKVIRPRTFLNNDYLWQYLQSCCQLQFSIVCSTYEQISEQKTGYIAGHVYTVLHAYQINFLGKKVRLLKLRNPWGNTQPLNNHYWGDNDPKWAKVDEQQKKRIQYEDKDDGIFFTPFTKLWNSFRCIVVSQINDNASYVYHSCKDTKSQGCYFTITISQDGIYSLQVAKTPKRLIDAKSNTQEYQKFIEKKYSDQETPSYSYKPPYVAVSLIYIRQNKGMKIKGFQSFRSQLAERKYRLAPGTYIAKVKVDFDKDLLQFPSLEDGNVNLAIYAEYPCAITQASIKQVKLFEQISNDSQKQLLIRVIQIQKLDILQKMLYVQKFKKQFTDLEFPARNKSIFGASWKLEKSLKLQDDQKWNKKIGLIQWREISKQMPQWKIFDVRPSPCKICPGFLKNYYFLAALQALAVKPHRIQRLFLKQRQNMSNYYSVLLLFKGKWVQVNLDEQIPFIDDKPAFSSSYTKELWVILLEKAYAKLYGSYKRIQFGDVQESLHNLTGAPIVTLQILENNFYWQSEQQASNPQDQHQIWKTLLNASQSNYIIVCEINDQQINKEDSYNLLKATEIYEKGQKVKIIQLRNFNFSRTQLSNQDFNTVLSFDDFLKNNSLVTIAEIDDNASYVFKSKKDFLGKGCYFRIQIQKQGFYSLQIDKGPKKMFQHRLWEIFQYPSAFIGLARLENGKAQKIFEYKSASRTTSQRMQMSPGTYIAKASIDFIKQWQRDYEVTLAIYADFPCTMSFASKAEAKMYEGKESVTWNNNQEHDLPKSSLLYQDLNIWRY